jgi:phage gpG-like protein
MASISGTIVGRDRLMKRFQTRRSELIRRMGDTMSGQMSRLAEYIRASKLSGQVLKNRTGTLRRSIHSSGSVDTSKNEVSGRVGTNVEYARVHEGGGSFLIPAHQRWQTMAFGRPIEPRFVAVRSHQARFTQRAFLRPSLIERRESILAALRQTASEVMSRPGQ